MRNAREIGRREVSCRASDSVGRVCVCSERSRRRQLRKVRRLSGGKLPVLTLLIMLHLEDERGREGINRKK